MAKKLNEDGIPTEIPSNTPKRTGSLFGDLDLDQQPKEGSPSSDDRAGVARPNEPGPDFGDEPPTRPATRHRDAAVDSYPSDTSEPRTVIAGGWRRSATPQQGTKPSVPTAKHDSMDDPVVGWLVVVDGPGAGSSLRLGSGQNSLGRGQEARVKLDFGDSQISRSTHAVVAYDPKGNRFYVQQGTGTNLTYLNGEPVLAPTPLPSGSELVLGETTLRFVAFCDNDFNWTDRNPHGR